MSNEKFIIFLRRCMRYKILIYMYCSDFGFAAKSYQMYESKIKNTIILNFETQDQFDLEQLNFESMLLQIMYSKWPNFLF